jgi:acyl-coenzyme A thioesterase PaaI-like protein
VSLRSRMRTSPRFARWMFNLWPCIRRTGARVTRISDDWLELDVCLPLNRVTRNYMGTIFGGSLYAAVDAWYTLMLIHVLGDGYVVWDRSAVIRFRRPGTSTLTAAMRITAGELDSIRTAIAAEGRIDRTYVVDLVDSDGVAHATVEKVVYIASRQAHDQRRAERAAAAAAAT